MNKKSKWLSIAAIMMPALFLLGACSSSDGEFRTKYKDIEGHWAEKYIIALEKDGLMDGDGDMFNPDHAISRELYIHMLVKALELAPAGDETINKLKYISDVPINKVFTDVNGSPYKESILTAQKKGILDASWYGAPGVYSFALKPGEGLTRIEMVRMAIHALGLYKEALELKGEPTGYEDDHEIPLRDAGFVILAKRNDLVGSVEGKFGPKTVATKAEACKVIARVRELRSNRKELDIPKSQGDFLWVGPMPFRAEWDPERKQWILDGLKPNGMRENWLNYCIDKTQWPTVFQETDVFKMYLNILPNMLYSGPHGTEERVRLTDEEMKKLTAFLKENRIKTAFELGGIREMPNVPLDMLGEKYAQFEIRSMGLQRWHLNGGTIDYITTDHAVMMYLDERLRGGKKMPEGMSVEELMDKLMDELCDYFTVMKNEFPDVKFGCIESLGYFEVDPVKYPSYFAPYTIKFTDYLDKLVKKMKERGLELDHFHIDAQIADVRTDGARNLGGSTAADNPNVKYDFGKIRFVEEYCRKKGIKTGYILNGGGDAMVYLGEYPDADRKIIERLMVFSRQYFETDPVSEHLVFQSWCRYPSKVGPEDLPYSEMYFYKNLILQEEYKRYKERRFEGE